MKISKIAPWAGVIIGTLVYNCLKEKREREEEAYWEKQQEELTKMMNRFHQEMANEAKNKFGIFNTDTK